MNLVHKIRGLWRFDGDTEPVLVSRRKFMFIGGVVAAASAVPWAIAAGPEEVWVAYVSSDHGVSALTASSYRAAVSMAEQSILTAPEYAMGYSYVAPKVVEMNGQRAFKVWTTDEADPLREVGRRAQVGFDKGVELWKKAAPDLKIFDGWEGHGDFRDGDIFDAGILPSGYRPKR